MQRVKLTADRIRDVACPADKKQDFLWDTEMPRLAVRVTAGAKSFVFESKLNRQTIRATIGSVNAWGIEEVRDRKTGEVRIPGARQEARRLQTLLDQGIDPRALVREQAEAKAAAKTAKELAQREAENRKRFTLRALCSAYVVMLEANGKHRSAASTRSIFKCHVLEPYPEIADTPARDITAHQIAAMVRRVVEQGKDRAAGILRSYLSAAFNAARKAPFDAKLPASLIPFGVASNPVEPVATIMVNAGNRTLSADELKAYMTVLGADIQDQVLRLALLAGGQRMAQLLRARVNDYDEQRQVLRLFDGKGKRRVPREHLLPLAPKAAALVSSFVARAKSREKEHGKAAIDIGSPWLFSVHGRVAMAFTTPGKRIAAISSAMKCEPFDLRDIRRTCETMLAGMGISSDIRARLLSHGLSGVQAKHYDRHEYMDEKRATLVAWEAKLEAIENSENGGA